MGKKRCFLGFFVGLFLFAFSANSFAAGYSCEKTYTSCNAGYYLDGSSQCVKCPTNYPNSASGNTTGGINNCYLTTTYGKYVATAGAGETTCAAGGYCPGLVTVYYDGVGGRTECPAGTFNNTTGSVISGACVECFTGSYNTGTGNTSCTACTNGKTTSGTGKTSCDANCPNASNVSGWANASWSANTNSVSNLCSITACATGYTRSGSTGATSSYVCIPNIVASASTKSLTYNGNAQSCANVTVSNPTSGATITYSTTENGTYNATAPTMTNVSESPKTVYYKVTAPNYAEASGSYTCTMAKANCSVSLGADSGTITYPNTGTFTASTNSGGALSVSSGTTSVATATITNGTVTVTPVKYGTATITVTSDATANYNACSATYDLTVNRGTCSISVTPTSGTITYPTTTSTFTINKGSCDGTITATSAATSKATVVLNSAKTQGTVTYVDAADATVITVTSEQSDKYNAATATYTVKTVKGTITANVEGNSKTFDGDPLSCDGNITNKVPSNATVTYATKSGSTCGSFSSTIPSRTNAGTTTVCYKISATNYTDKTGEFACTVAEAGTIAVNAGKKSKVYDGTALTCNITVTTPSSGATVKYGTSSGTYNLNDAPTVTNVADSKTIYYQVTAANYTAKTGSFECEITNATITANVSDKTLTYNGTTTSNGTAQSCANVSNIVPSDAALTFATQTGGSCGSYGTSAPTITNADEITVCYKLEKTNYNTLTGTYKCTMNAKNMTVNASTKKLSYNGNAQSCANVTVSAPTSGATITYSTTENGTYGTAPTLTTGGSQTIYYKVTGNNFNTKTGSYLCTMNQVVLSGNGTEVTYPTTAGSFTVTTNTSGGTLSATSSDESVVTATISGTTVNLTFKKAGTATITVTSAAKGDYAAASATYSVKVNNKTITINKNTGTGTCAGASGTNAGSITCTYGGTCTAPSWNSTSCNITKDSNYLASWYSNANGTSGTNYAFGADLSNAPTTIYAKWTACATASKGTNVASATFNAVESNQCKYTHVCNTGYYHESHNTKTTAASIDCSACTNKPASNSSYTGAASSNACEWQCSGGYYKNGNACTACANGSFSAAGATSCTACDGGKTNTGTANTTCSNNCDGFGTTVATWNTPTWNASTNTVSNLCSPKTYSGYTITYKAGIGGSGTDQTQSVTYNANFTTKAANTFTKANATFAGWSAASGSYPNANTTYKYTTQGDNTLTATWTCNAGYYKAANGSCANVEPGTYSPDGDDNVYNCPANTTTITATPASIDDCVCAAGYSGTSYSSCTACTKGYYKATAGNTSCTIADTGYYVDTTAATKQTKCPDDTQNGSVTTTGKGTQTNTLCYTTRENVDLDETPVTGAGDQTCFFGGTSYNKDCTIKIKSCIGGHYLVSESSTTCAVVGKGAYSPAGDTDRFLCSNLSGANSTVTTTDVDSDSATDCYNTCSTINIDHGSRVPTSDKSSYNGTTIPACTYTTTCVNGYEANGETCKATSYTISYTLNGGTHGASHPTSATFDTEITISNPTKTGYTFTGWNIAGMDNKVAHYYGDNSTTDTSLAGVKATKFKNLHYNKGTVTFTATWTANTFNVSYNAGTGASGTAPSSPTWCAYDDTNCKAPSNTYTKPGYTFAGWACSASSGSCASATYAAGAAINTATTVAGATITLTATWTANTFNVAYNAGTGGFGNAPTSPTSCTYNGTCKAPANTYTRTGYSFAGWACSASTGNCTSPTYAADASISTATTVAGATITLTATWTPNNYSISLDDSTNGGANGSGTIYTTYATNVYKDSARSKAMTASANNVTIPTKTNAVFLGYFSASSNGTKYIDASGYITSDGITAAKVVANNTTKWYAQFAGCTCTPGDKVDSCTVTGVSNNVCKYTYTCEYGYNNAGNASGTFSGSAGVANKTSPNCGDATPFQCEAGKKSDKTTACPIGYYCPGEIVSELDKDDEEIGCARKCPTDIKNGDVATADTGSTRINQCQTTRANVELDETPVTGAGDQTCFFGGTSYDKDCTIKITSCVGGHYRVSTASTTCAVVGKGAYSPAGDTDRFLCSNLSGANSTVTTTDSDSDSASDCYNTCSTINIDHGSRVPTSDTVSFNGTTIPACTYKTPDCDTGYIPSGETCEPNVYKITLNHNGGSVNGNTATYDIYLKYNTGWYSNYNSTTKAVSGPITSVTKPVSIGNTFGGYFAAGQQIIDGTGKLTTNYTVFTAPTLITANWDEIPIVNCAAGTYYTGYGTTCTECPAGSYCTGTTPYQDNGSVSGLDTCPADASTYTAATNANNQTLTVSVSSAKGSTKKSDCFASNVKYSATQGAGSQTCYFNTATNKYVDNCKDEQILTCTIGHWLDTTKTTKDCSNVGYQYYSPNLVTTRTKCPNTDQDPTITTETDVSEKVSQCYRGNIWYEPTGGHSGHRRNCYHKSDESDTNISTGYSYNCNVSVIVTCDAGYYDDGSYTNSDGDRDCVPVGKGRYSPAQSAFSGEELQPSMQNPGSSTQRYDCPVGTGAVDVVSTTPDTATTTSGSISDCYLTCNPTKNLNGTTVEVKTPTVSYGTNKYNTCVYDSNVCPEDMWCDTDGFHDCPTDKDGTPGKATLVEGQKYRGIDTCYVKYDPYTATTGYPNHNWENGTGWAKCFYTNSTNDYSNCMDVDAKTCNAGYYYKIAGSFACSGTETGYYSGNGATAQTECPAGWAGSTEFAGSYTACYTECNKTPASISNSKTVSAAENFVYGNSATTYNACSYNVVCKTGYDVKNNNTAAPTCDAHEYTITLNKNGGTGSTAPSVKCTFDSGVCALPAIVDTRTGYSTANKWCTAANGGGTCYNAGTTVTTNISSDASDIELFAQWTPNVYEITLNHNGATTAGSPAKVYLKYATGWYSNATATTAITTLVTKPQKTGYEFAGYYDTNDNEIIGTNGKFSTSAVALTFTSTNTEITAKWPAGNTTCAAKTYYSGSGSTCLPCTENHYCPGGSFATDDGVRGLNACPDGGKSPANSESSAACYKELLPTYVATHGRGTQTCYYNENALTYSANCKDFVMTSCDAGYYLKNTNDTDCSAVGVGYYSANNILTRDACPNGGTTKSDNTTAETVQECFKINLDYAASNGSGTGTQSCWYSSGTGNNAVYGRNCFDEVITKCRGGYYLKNASDKTCSVADYNYYSAEDELERHVCPNEGKTTYDNTSTISECWKNGQPYVAEHGGGERTCKWSVADNAYLAGCGTPTMLYCDAGYWLANATDIECSVAGNAYYSPDAALVRYACPAGTGATDVTSTNPGTPTETAEFITDCRLKCNPTKNLNGTIAEVVNEYVSYNTSKSAYNTCMYDSDTCPEDMWCDTNGFHDCPVDEYGTTGKAVLVDNMKYRDIDTCYILYNPFKSIDNNLWTKGTGWVKAFYKKSTNTYSNYTDMGALTCDAGYYYKTGMECSSVDTCYYSPEQSYFAGETKPTVAQAGSSTYQIACPAGCAGSTANAGSYTACYTECDKTTADFANSKTVSAAENIVYGNSATTYNACSYNVVCKTGYDVKNNNTAAPTCDAHEYTITLNKNGGTGSTAPSVKCTFDSGVCALPAIVDTRTGYSTANKWCTAANGGGTCYNAGTTVTTNISSDASDIELFAQWTPNVYEITLNHNGATTAGSPAKVYLKYATGWYSNAAATTAITALATKPVKGVLKFDGYKNTSNVFVIDSDGKFATTSAILTFTTADATLTAQWSDAPITCPAGKYYRGTGEMPETDCLPCTENNYCSGVTVMTNSGQAGIDECPDNGKSLVGTASATMCFQELLPTYVATHGRGTQTCYYNENALTYSDRCKDFVITSCDAGHWLATTTDTDCSAAGVGYYSANNILTRDACPNGGTTKSDNTTAETVDECFKTNLDYTATDSSGTGTQSCWYSSGTGNDAVYKHECFDKVITKCRGGYYLAAQTDIACTVVDFNYYSIEDELERHACPNEGKTSYNNTSTISECWKNGQPYVAEHGGGERTCKWSVADNAYLAGCGVPTMTYCNGGYWLANGTDTECSVADYAYYSPDRDLARYACPAGSTTRTQTSENERACFICPENSVCEPGLEVATCDSLTGGQFTKSDAGTTDAAYCYRDCTMGENANTMSGRDFYTAADTCQIASCAPGYSLSNGQCVTCPAGSFCDGTPGGDGGNGAKSCADLGDGSWMYSAPGANKASDCYRMCTEYIEDTCTLTPVENTAYWPNNCQYTGASATGNPAEVVDGRCVETSCNSHYEMINGSCKPCNRENALSYKSDGNCVIESCTIGYHPYNNTCEQDVKGCAAPHATAATQKWDATHGAFGICTIKSCEDGFHLASNACVENEQACDIEHGVGTKTWNATTNSWNECVATSCVPGYTNDPYEKNNASEQCSACRNKFSVLGEVAAASYSTGCEIASCLYQGEKYNLENNECVPICAKPYSDETGSLRWNNATKKCERTCNPGYISW